jgi:hypothetical protein
MFGKSDIISYNLTENAESNHDFAIPPSECGSELAARSAIM